MDAESTAKAIRDTTEGIKHLPPEQRAMAEQMMKQAAGSKSTRRLLHSFSLKSPCSSWAQVMFSTKMTKSAEIRENVRGVDLQRHAFATAGRR